MYAFVTKDVEVSTSAQFQYYKSRYELWNTWKASCQLEKLLAHMSRVFVDLFQEHRSGAEPFARFLVSWYRALGELACSELSNDSFSDVWLQLTQEKSNDILNEDKSALVFAIGGSCYTFMRKQV